MMKHLGIPLLIILSLAATDSLTITETIRKFKYKSISMDLYSLQTLKEGDTIFSISNLFDNNPSTCWATPFNENESKNSDHYDKNRIPIRVEFNKPIYLRSIVIKNGFQRSENLYINNYRAKNIIINVFLEGEDGFENPLGYELQDSPESQKFDVSKKVMFSSLFPTRELWIDFESVFQSKKYSDLCISDIELVYSDNMPYKPKRRWVTLKQLIDKNKTGTIETSWDWPGLFESKEYMLEDLIYYSLCKNREAIKYIKSLNTSYVIYSEILNIEIIPRLKAILKEDF